MDVVILTFIGVALLAIGSEEGLCHSGHKCIHDKIAVSQ